MVHDRVGVVAGGDDAGSNAVAEGLAEEQGRVPFVIAADVYGEPPHLGRAGWSWYTGSAGWMLRVAVESILGLHLEGGHAMRINPCISSEWPEARIQYRALDQKTRFEIVICNPRSRQCGVTSATCDDVALVVDGMGAHLPLNLDGRTHRVIIEL